ncbi:MAG: GntR family transcriptional regulator [Lachnospiraceae bacterium]|nr:GntR family transcriptional regulator [Lachnospiraceae bacterium]
MPWNLDSKRPIYEQLIERVMQDIVTGNYKPGEKLPSVRELATLAAVNPNTMQRALAELETSGLINTQRTSGRFVTDDAGLIQQARQNLALTQVRTYIYQMQQLQITPDEMQQLLAKTLEEGTL